MPHSPAQFKFCGSLQPDKARNGRVRPLNMSQLQSPMLHFCCSPHHPQVLKSLLLLWAFCTKFCFVIFRFQIQCGWHRHCQGWGKGYTVHFSSSDSCAILLVLCPLCSSTLSGNSESSLQVGCPDCLSPAFYTQCP